MLHAVKHDRDSRAICNFLDVKKKEKPSLKRGRMNTLIQSTFLLDFYNITVMSSSRWYECPSHIPWTFQSMLAVCLRALALSTTAIRPLRLREMLPCSLPTVTLGKLPHPSKGRG